ncbi:MAG: 5-bromo-4-chloroindolyl phosphate hydrolysis family protein [Oscillospiraceae bacterium]|jgi:DNA-binding Lrp family transcriptional regulator
MAAAEKQQKHKAKGTGSAVAGVALILFSLLMLATWHNQPLPLSPGGWIRRLVLAVLCYLGAEKLSKGLRLRRLGGKLPLLESLFDYGGRIPLAQAAQSTGVGLSSLVRDVRELQKQGMVQGMYADLLRGELVYETRGGTAVPQKEAEPLAIVLREEHRQPVAPLYSLGFAWVVYAIFFPMLHITDYLLAAILSLIAYFTTAWRSPKAVIIREEVQPSVWDESTGNAALDDLLKGVQGHLANLRRLDRSIDGKLDVPVQELLSITRQIVEQLRKNPQSVGQMRQFFNYTLPTTVGLLEHYEELSRQPVKGKNITDAMAQVEEKIGFIVEAFRRQLDALFQDKALNIAVELQVMEGLLRSDDMGKTLDDKK